MPDKWGYPQAKPGCPHRISPAKYPLFRGFSPICPLSYPQGSLFMSVLTHTVNNTWSLPVEKALGCNQVRKGGLHERRGISPQLRRRRRISSTPGHRR